MAGLTVKFLPRTAASAGPDPTPKYQKLHLAYSGTFVLIPSMSRVKEFDEAEVLDQALELFRARGFKHTSFADLTSELGVSRQSLYDTYGDKQTLYQTALKRYVDRGMEFIRRKFDEDTPVRETFATFLNNLIEGTCANGAPGCFMVNSMVELSPHDADTRALAQTHARELEGIFATRLSAAQRQGQLALTKDPVTLARYFYHTMLGIAVSSRALGDKDSLRKTAQIAVQALD
jgi:TetR/AcrR family transcriptional regulator, transcriptional repressor for nem operon